MAQAKAGDTVRVSYTGRFEDGTVFDSSEGRDPLEFKIGEGQVIPGFEEAVDGMNPGDKKTVTIPAEQAYGEHDDQLVMVVGKEEFPEDLKPEVGDQLQLSDPDGNVFMVTVSEVTDKTITLDANHPLAGEDLTFDIELAEIVSPIIRF